MPCQFSSQLDLQGSRVDVVVDMDVGIAVLLEVACLVDSYHGAAVRAGLSGDDELPTDSPVIASVSLVEIGPTPRTDRKYTMVLFRGQVSKFTPAHSATSLD